MGYGSSIATGATVGSVVPGVGTAVGAGVGAAAQFIGNLFRHRGDNKRNDELRRSQVAALTLRQKQQEDARRARLAYGQGLLGRVPSTVGESATAGSEALDPALYDQLNKERTYNFGAAVPNANAGSGSAFLSGLFDEVRDFAPYMANRSVASASDGTGLDATTVPPDSGVDLEYLRSLSHTAPGRGPYDPRPSTGR